ncbi:hypothetical protein ACE41H_21305 [Paenibacillus enshidis]|uniref:Uncharacterized protein n=1 Tax=Paenibacillus enshidis TaxID=1458439 RepID=A0ABV5AYL0_9BACL
MKLLQVKFIGSFAIHFLFSVWMLLKVVFFGLTEISGILNVLLMVSTALIVVVFPLGMVAYEKISGSHDKRLLSIYSRAAFAAVC